MFKVSARTVLELGSELISSDAIAFYELIKNGIDAGTKNGVSIHFHIVLGRRDYQEIKSQIHRIIQGTKHDNIPNLKIIKERLEKKLNTESEELWDQANVLLKEANISEDLLDALEKIYSLNSITISDTGSGMSLQDLHTVFLLIGTSSRKNEIDTAIKARKSQAPFLGEKGIGRLSAMRLGDRLLVKTARTEDEHYNCLDIDWSDFNDASKMIGDIDVNPQRGRKKRCPDYSGTDIRIEKLSGDWSKKRVERLAVDDFSLLANPLDNVSGVRIAVFWNGERISFSRLEKSFLSHANALIQGKYHTSDDGPKLELRIELINIGFEHKHEVSIETATANDLCGALVGPRAKRRRMDKRDLDYEALHSVGSFNFELHWFNRRILRKVKSKAERQALSNSLNQWMGVRLYRDGFRVYPYGAEDDDWLELDKTALASKGYALNRIQIVGQVEISRMQNPELIDQTNREGLRQTPEEAVLKETVQFAVERLRDEMKRITKEQKDVRETFVSDEVKTASLEERMKVAIRSIRDVMPPEHRATVQKLELTHEEFVRYAAKAREHIDELEKDADQMLAMAGIGLMVEVVAHELTRSAENALDVLNGLKRKAVPGEIRLQLESLRASMTSINKRLRILDPLSVTARQRKERFNLNELINEILEAHEAKFKRHEIKLKVLLPDKPVRVLAVKGMVVQVLENLISNSVYWIDIESQRKLSFKPKLTISVENNPPRIQFSDNGPGVSEQYKDRIFDLYFSLKDKNHRRGLGLYIAREAAEHNGGALVLDMEEINAEGRMSTFDYRVVGDEN